jgi:hypothetical protein
MDAGKLPALSNISDEHDDHEEDCNIDWFSDGVHANDLIRAGDAFVPTPLRSCLDSQASNPQTRSQAAQAKKQQAGDHLQLWQVLSTAVPVQSGPGSFVDPRSHSLDELVDRLVHPDCDSIEMNNLGTAIVMHPDITKRNSKLNMYSKMNGGMKYYSPGTTQAWLYMPKKRRSPRDDDDEDDALSNNARSYAALVVVYPDKLWAPGGIGTSKGNFSFGGRAHALHSCSDFIVLIQHGAYRALGYVGVHGQSIVTSSCTCFAFSPIYFMLLCRAFVSPLRTG